MRKLLALLALLPLTANAAISFVAGTYSQTTSSNTRTLSEPAGAAQNDVILVYCQALVTSGITWVDPADFTEINQKVTTAGSPSQKSYLGYKIRGATAGNALTFSHSDSNSNIACQAVAYRGVDTSTPFDVTFVEATHYQQGAANTPNMTAKPITTVSNNDWVVLFYGATQSISGAAGPPSGYTTDADNLSTGFSNRSTYVAHKLVASAGVETPGAFTHTDVTGSMDPHTHTLALKAGGPTFTAGPAAGTFTQTTMPTTFTTDQDGTVEGVACANGIAAPSVAQVFADQCGDGNAAVNSFDETVVSGVSDGHTFTGLTAGTTYDLYFAIDGTTSDSSAVSSLLDQVTVAVPTFTSGPATGTLTSTTAQITGTPSQSGTWYGLACTNGQTATAAQVKTGTTCSGGAAIAAFNKSVTAAAADSQTFTGLAASTTYDTFHVISNAAGDSASVPLADVVTQAAAAPSFTSGPSIAAAANGYTVSGTVTCTGTCSVEAVACSPGDAAPTSNEIEAGQCGGGNAAILNTQENWTTTVADSFSLAAASKPVKLSVYVSATNGTDDSTVVPFLSQNRSARSGFAIVTMASHSAAGLCNLDSYFAPDCADGDTFEYEDDTNESSDCNVAIAANGELTLTPVAAGDCDGRQTFEVSYEDVSSATDGLFTSPSVGNFSTDDTAYVNNSAPDCHPEPEIYDFALTVGVAMTSIDLGDLGTCTDADADTLTYSVTSGTLPTGTSLSGTGNKTWGGTPSVEDEGGEALTVQACDVVGDCDTFDFTVFAIDTWQVPNCVGLTSNSCSEAIVAAAPWRINAIGLTITALTCSSSVTVGNILTQNPLAADEADPYGEMLITLATDTTTMPDLTGLTLAQALAVLAALCP